jgi:uncharacterized protein
MINVEVVYALPDEQVVVGLQVAEGTTALQAAMESGIAERFGLNLETIPMGIYSRALDGRSLPLPGEYLLRERDRVELYRPLTIDPKQARLLRAERARKRNT